ncbi:hypothetical protein DPMN_156826 [Dreissena polymorpha]|uniref:Uncharacterized protein n=1 Tax=Dreissena polymorpha TaxID=45954 RepID=A0A9D4FPN3_DREPO|nr:hypothetical protein DPMN_156826 [Dreissena polymorpha]
MCHPLKTVLVVGIGQFCEVTILLFSGSEDVLHKFGVTVVGDQLTTVRLEEAKNLCALATTPNKRFEDLHPFVIELLHTKQDFLED